MIFLSVKIKTTQVEKFYDSLSGGFRIKMVIIKIAIGLVIIILSFVFLLKSGEDSLLSLLMKKKNIGTSEANSLAKSDAESDDEADGSCEDLKDKI